MTKPIDDFADSDPAGRDHPARPTAPAPWQTLDTAPLDGTRILLCRAREEPFIGWWTADVYKEQGGKGGQAGWFSGRYSDHWGDRPIMESPDYWMPLPEAPEE